MQIPRLSINLYKLMVVVAAVAVMAYAASLVSRVSAQPQEPSESGRRLVTIYDRGIERVVLTDETTIGDALKAAGVKLDEADAVEPSIDEEMVASNYHINIYRARPVVVVDGAMRKKIVSAYQTPAHIAKAADVTVYPEDITTVEPSRDILVDGLSLKMTIDRATPFTLVMYGKRIEARTQSDTVGEMLIGKDIELKSNDVLSVDSSATIKAGMTVEIWRNGVQTVTEDKDIDFDIERIEDANREVGYRDIKTAGEKGKRTVTYEVNMKNGNEISRKEISSVTTKQPKKQVEIVGAKSNFDGDFAAALAKLRSCEGGYNSWNPAGPYYGAYQFDQRTWNSVSSAPYGSASPAEQDAAARALYERRGWQPWPHCGANLPDTFR